MPALTFDFNVVAFLISKKPATFALKVKLLFIDSKPGAVNRHQDDDIKWK